MRKPGLGVSDQVSINQPVQSQKKARSLTFQIKEEEGLYSTCSEKKGADQLWVFQPGQHKPACTVTEEG